MAKFTTLLSSIVSLCIEFVVGCAISLLLNDRFKETNFLTGVVLNGKSCLSDDDLWGVVAHW